MSEDPVTYERRGPVAVVTIDRPERKNAVDAATAEALAAARERFADGDADVLVLTGAGGDFSAGADLKAFDLEDRPEGYLGLTRTRVEKPTVAAVEGYCVAGGLELALWCDLRVAAEGATFGCLERRFGVPLVDGGTQRLPRVVGLGRALDMIVTGREVDAETAEDWGLVTRVVEDGTALESAVELAERVATYPQATLRSDLAATYDGLGEPLATGLELEAAHGAAVLDDAADGAARFAAGAGRGGDWPVEAGEGGGAGDEDRERADDRESDRTDERESERINDEGDGGTSDGGDDGTNKGGDDRTNKGGDDGTNEESDGGTSEDGADDSDA